MTASIELTCEDSSVLVSPTGASLHRYTVGERAVVVSMNTFDGAVLAPWPNRITDGRYDFEGRSHQLPITEPARRTALHGLVAEADWTVVEADESSVRLELALEPTQGYPFPFALSMAYDLRDDGLRIRAEARNTGSHRAPFGFGFHPWFAPGAHAGSSDRVDDSCDRVDDSCDRVDDAQLVVPAAAWLETDERLIPTGVRPFDDGTVVPVDHGVEESDCIVCKDFRALRTIGATQLDDSFSAPRRDVDGWSRARVRGTDDREIVIGIGPGFRTWQVYTGDGLEAALARRAIAIEPMTCPPNAFASGVEGEDFDVVEPGGTLTVEWSISLAPDGNASPSADGVASPPSA